MYKNNIRARFDTHTVRKTVIVLLCFIVQTSASPLYNCRVFKLYRSSRLQIFRVNKFQIMWRQKLGARGKYYNVMCTLWLPPRETERSKYKHFYRIRLITYYITYRYHIVSTKQGTLYNAVTYIMCLCVYI